MTNTAQLPTRTLQAVFAYREDGLRFRVSEPTDDWRAAVAQWHRLDDPRFEGQTPYIGETAVRFYAVRDMADPDWQDAPRAYVSLEGPVRESVTPRQLEALEQLAQVLPTPRHSIRPGYEYDRWYGTSNGRYASRPGYGRMDTRDLSRICKPLAARGLVVMRSVPYGPVTYWLTGRGRTVLALAKSAS